MADSQLMIFNFFEKPEFFKPLDHCFSGGKTIKTGKLPSKLVHYSAFIHDYYLIKIMAAPYFKVIWIMRWSNFYGTRAKGFIDIFIGNNRYLTIEKW